MSLWRPDIFRYLNYRDYLAAYYLAAKVHVRGFSYRAFSRKAGFASPNFLKLVIEGDRNLGEDSISKVSHALSLTGEEERYFRNLVAYDQAGSAEEQARRLEAITTTRRFMDARPLEGLMLQYLSRWYHVAIRELAARPDFRPEPAWIVRQLVEPVTLEEAQASLTLLLDLGLLERDETGRIHRGEPTLDAGHEVQSAGAWRFHRSMLTLASSSLDAVPPASRDFGALTVCVRADALPELKRRLQEFREQMMDLCDQSEAPDTVYQLNVQLFPLSWPGGTP